MYYSRPYTEKTWGKRLSQSLPYTPYCLISFDVKCYNLTGYIPLLFGNNKTKCMEVFCVMLNSILVIICFVGMQNPNIFSRVKFLWTESEQFMYKMWRHIY